MLSLAAFVWGILIPELKDNSEKRMGINKWISRDQSILSQMIERFGMLLKKNVLKQMS